MSAPSAEITRLLRAWSGGDPAALEQLAEKVYLRLVDVAEVEWRERAQFFAMAAQMMRRILVNAAHARTAQKRGGKTPKLNGC